MKINSIYLLLSVLAIVFFLIYLAPNPTLMGTLPTLPMGGLFITSVFALIVAERENFHSRILKKQLVVVAAYVVTIFLSLIVFPSLDMPGIFVVNAEAIFSALSTINHNVIVQTVIYALAVAVFEETIYRRFLINFLIRKNISERISIMVSAVIFFMVHLSFNPTILMIGFLFGYLYVRFRSLIVVVAIHTICDALSFVGDKIKVSENQLISPSITIEQLIKGSSLIAILLFSTGLIFCAVLARFFNKISKNKPISI